MTAIDSLMLEAKQAIMDDHHRRFQTLHQEGKWEEALQEIHVTLSCAADLLNESIQVLEKALDGYPAMFPSPSRNHVANRSCPATPLSHDAVRVHSVIFDCADVILKLERGDPGATGSLDSFIHSC